MTKTDVLALGAEWDYVADLHLSVGDHDPVDEKLHELALLLEGSLSEPGPYPCAKRLDRADPASKLRLMVHLSFQLLSLDLQGLCLLLQLPAPALILRQRDHAAEVGFGQALQLLLEAHTPAAQVLAACLKGLWQPVSSPLARAIAWAMLSGWVSSSQRSCHTRASSWLAGIKRAWHFSSREARHGIGFPATD